MRRASLTPRSPWNKPGALLPLLCLLLAAALLGARRLASNDLGYHLADAEASLAQGWPVDTAPQLWGVRGLEGELPPGAWRDAEGRLHAVSSSWLSQLVMLGAWRVAQGTGLWLLQLGTVLGLCGLMLVAGRRLGLTPGWALLGALWVLLAGFERFELRPALLGRCALAGQLALLAPALAGRPLRRGALWASLALQVLAVNLHGSSLLGVGLGIALVCASLVRRRRRIRSATLLAGLLLASFVHPQGWRAALYPLQTLRFLAQHQVGRTTAHPWSVIGEFQPPFDPGFVSSWATPAFAALLVAAVAGLLLAAWRRRWACALLLLAALGVGLTMRRSLLVAAIMAAPPALLQLQRLRRWRRPARRWTGRLAGLLAAGVAAALLAGVFFSPQQPWKLAPGLSRFDLPLQAAELLSRRPLKGRLWTDFDSSSNLSWFVTWRPAVPLITNTFVYPAAHLGHQLELLRGQRDLRAESASVVVLSSTGLSAPLLRTLAADPGWALVQLGPRHLVFVDRRGPDAGLAAEALEPADFSVASYGHQLRTLGADPLSALLQGGQNLERLQWYGPAAHLAEEAVAVDRHSPSSWGLLGAVLAARGLDRLLAGDAAGREDWLAARWALRRAVELGDPRAAINLDLLGRQLEALREGVLLTPAGPGPREETP